MATSLWEGKISVNIIVNVGYICCPIQELNLPPAGNGK